MKTYQQVVETFQSAFNAHLAINSFAEGALDYLDAVSQDIKYPFIFLRPITSTGIVLNDNGISGTRQLTFEMYSMDIPQLKNASPLKIKSDTEQYIYDLIAYINLGSQQQTEWCTLNNILPVDEAFNDRVYGWVATLNYNDSYVLDYCAFPSLAQQT
jgi:hypothetical protein